jgi:hypothetical protein
MAALDASQAIGDRFDQWHRVNHGPIPSPHDHAVPAEGLPTALRAQCPSAN